MERASSRSLRHRASALVADDARAAFALLERARAAGLGSLTVVVGRREAELPVVPKEELLASPVAAVTVEGFGYDPASGELWFAGETAEALLLEMQARRRALAAELDEVTTRRDAQIPDSAYAVEANRARRGSSPSPSVSSRALDVSAERFEAPLRDGDTGAAAELGAELRKLGAAEVELRQELAAVTESASGVEIEAARLGAEADEARRRLEAAGADEAAEGDDRDALAAKVERLERRREGLGAVDPLAKEEYEAEKGASRSSRAQRIDLEESLAELEKLSKELADTVERRFAETFDAVQKNSPRSPAHSSPAARAASGSPIPRNEDERAGRRGRAPPVGKKVQRLSLLSGGEKALGAISFLFALFLARPCPFYLLDEVEAALDDTNIGRFVDLLRRYSDRAQFVVITHQKRTMEAADILYGVTMGGDGVWQIVSRRLPREDAEAVSAA